MTKIISEIYPKVNCHDPIPYLIEKKLPEWQTFEPGEDLFFTTGNAQESALGAKLAFNVVAKFTQTAVNKALN